MTTVQRASELFALASRPSGSHLVDETWWACSVPVPAFISVAAGHWEMVVTRQWGTARLTVRGPETRAMPMPIPQDAEFFGIRFSLGTFMPGLPPARLVDRAVTLPAVGGDSVRLDGRVLELDPTPLTASWRHRRRRDCSCTTRSSPTAESVHLRRGRRHPDRPAEGV